MAQSTKQKKAAAKARAQQRARNKHKKPNARETLETQVANLQSALFSIRQMYDSAMQEKAAVEAQVIQRDQLLTALAVEYTGVSVKRETVNEVGRGDYVGYEQELEDDELFIFAIHKDDLEQEEVVEVDGDTEEMEEEDGT